jgi:hypothetical protein
LKLLSFSPLPSVSVYQHREQLSPVLPLRSRPLLSGSRSSWHTLAEVVEQRKEEEEARQEEQEVSGPELSRCLPFSRKSR